MTGTPLTIGDVITARFPQQLPNGREQEGYRPAVVLGVPQHTGSMRYPMLIVAPLTTDRGQPWVAGNSLYPGLPAGTGGLPADSVVLLDQVRALDVTRMARLLGTLIPGEYAPIQQGLKELLEF